VFSSKVIEVTIFVLANAAVSLKKRTAIMVKATTDIAAPSVVACHYKAKRQRDR
jgi:hypothetical protein